MSESLQFWAGFSFGLGVSVLGIIIGIGKEAKYSTSRFAPILTGLGGVLMIVSMIFWRNPKMPAIQAYAVIFLLLMVGFAAIGLALLKYPHESKGGADGSSNSNDNR